MMKQALIVLFSMMALVFMGCANSDNKQTFAEYLSTLPSENAIDSDAVMAAVRSSTETVDSSIYDAQTAYATKGAVRSIAGIDGIDTDTTYTKELAILEDVMSRFCIREKLWDTSLEDNTITFSELYFDFQSFEAYYAPVYGNNAHYLELSFEDFTSELSGVAVNAPNFLIHDEEGIKGGCTLTPAVVSWDWDYSANAKAVAFFGTEHVINLLIYSSTDATTTSGSRVGVYISTDTERMLGYSYNCSGASVD